MPLVMGLVPTGTSALPGKTASPSYRVLMCVG